MPSMTHTLVVLILGFVARVCMTCSQLNETMRGYPHFTSPLNNIRELKEMLYLYGRTGDFYAKPSQVGQSELLMKFLFWLKEDFKDDTQSGSNQAIACVSGISEIASMIF